MKGSAKLTATPLLPHFIQVSPKDDEPDRLAAILRDGIIRGSLGAIPGKQPTVGSFDVPPAQGRRPLAEGERRRIVGIDLRRDPPVDSAFERAWRARGERRWPVRGALVLVDLWRDVEEFYDRFDGTPSDVFSLANLLGRTR